MRIGIVIYSLNGGGAERVTALLANSWAQAGNVVTVITLSLGETVYHLDDKVQHVSLGVAKSSPTFLGAVWNNWRSIHSLRRQIKQSKLDVVIGMMGTSAVLVGFASALIPIRTIGAERSYPPHRSMGKFWEILRKHVYGRLDVVVGQTEVTSRWLRENTAAVKVLTIPNPVVYPVPSGQPRLAPADVLEPHRKILLAVGRLVEEKGFVDLVSCFAALSKRNPAWDLVILGEGRERAKLEELIADFQLESRVYLPGRVGNVDEWFSRAQIFALTSRFEGFPNALAEALAAGVPAVSYDCHAGPADIIRHGIDGFLVAPGDKSSLGQTLDNLMNDPDRRNAMGLRAMEIRDRYSLPAVLAAWQVALSGLKDN